MTSEPGSVGNTTVNSTDAPQSGEVLAGKYRVVSTLGAGGMGVVVLVEHIELGQRMAIKLMIPGVIQDGQAVARFLREARSAAGLQSEHVVRIFDVGTLETGAPYMVMELLRGEDLSQVLLNAGRLEIRDAVDYVLQACHAIAEAHAMGIVHRDLKPSNLFLTRRSDGTPLVKVLDFGISKATNPDSGGVFSANLTATSAVMGSPLYMSPEQVRDAKQVDARADIWSLGVILHELLTGNPAFHADTLPGICAAIIADDPPPLRSLRPDAPPELEAVVGKCLEKNVRNRFQSTRDLMLSLRNFASTGARLNMAAIPVAQTMKEAGISSRPSGPLASGRVTPASQVAPIQSAKASVPRSDQMTQASPSHAMSAPGVPPNAATSAVPVASSNVPQSKASPTRRAPIFIGLGVLAVVAIGAFALGTNRDRKHENGAAAASSAPAIAAPRKSFVLVIDSTPSGAAVREDHRVLGTTPIQLTIDNDSVRTEPRKLVVHREGFQRYSILQGPSDDNVRIIASLVPEPTEAPAASTKVPVSTSPHPKPTKPAAPPSEHATQPPAPPPPPPPPAPPPPAGDIRLQR